MQYWMMKSLHHWLGLIFSAFFFVICMSGAMLAVVQGSSQPAKAYDDPKAPIIFDSHGSAEAVTLIMEQSELGLSPSRLEFPVHSRAVFRLSYKSGERQYFDPTDFSALGSPVRPSSLWRIHANLLGLWGVGDSFVIWTGLAGVYLALLGLLIFIPQWRGFRRKSILHPQNLSFREMRRSHMSSGIVFAVFVIFFGLTGWGAGAPEDARRLIGSLDGYKRLDIDTAPIKQSSIFHTDSISAIMTDSLTRQPKSGLSMMSWIDISERSSFAVMGVKLSYLDGSELFYDLQTANFQGAYMAADIGFWTRLGQSMPLLHSGEGLGWVYRICLIIFGSISGLIALTGLASYLLKWNMKIRAVLTRRQKKHEQPLK